MGGVAGRSVGRSALLPNAFSGEVTLARKHTRHIERDLPLLVDRAVGRLGDNRQPVSRDYQLQEGGRVSATPTKVEGAAIHDMH